MPCNNWKIYHKRRNDMSINNPIIINNIRLHNFIYGCPWTVNYLFFRKSKINSVIHYFIHLTVCWSIDISSNPDWQELLGSLKLNDFISVNSSHSLCLKTQLPPSECLLYQVLWIKKFTRLLGQISMHIANSVWKCLHWKLHYQRSTIIFKTIFQ